MVVMDETLLMEEEWAGNALLVIFHFSLDI